MRSPPSNPPLYNNIIIQSALVYNKIFCIAIITNMNIYIYVIPRRIMGVHDDDTPNRTERNPENNVDVPRQCWT